MSERPQPEVKTSTQKNAQPGRTPSRYPMGSTIPSEHGYKAPFICGEVNEDFWREVFEGHTIKQVVFGSHGVKGFELDDGQQVRLVIGGHEHATVCIED